MANRPTTRPNNQQTDGHEGAQGSSNTIFAWKQVQKDDGVAAMTAGCEKENVNFRI